MKLGSFASKLLMCLAAILIFKSSTAAAQQTPVTIEAYYAPIQFEFDGKQLAPPEAQMSFIYNGSTYVPLRFIAYSLDKAVEWDGDTYTVSVREPSKTESVSIQEYKMNREQRAVNKGKVDASKLNPTSISVYFEKVQYKFDGTSKEPKDDVPGLIYQDSLYVPMRFVSESTGKKIDWDPETYTIKATVKESLAQVEVKGDEKTEAVAVPQGGAVPGGLPGGAAVKPTAEALTAQAEAKLNGLLSSAESTFTSLKGQYKAATTQEAKLAVLASGWDELSRIDANFNSIMDELRSALTANGYDTSIVQTFVDQYNAKKDAEMKKLGL